MDVVQSHTLHRTHFCQYYQLHWGDYWRLPETAGGHWSSLGGGYRDYWRPQMMTGNEWRVQRPVQKRTLESTEITGD